MKKDFDFGELSEIERRSSFDRMWCVDHKIKNASYERVLENTDVILRRVLFRSVKCGRGESSFN